jgi:hypothetical protein
MILWNQSYLEAGVDECDIPDPNEKPNVCVYPATFIERVNHLGFEKTFDFNFRGALYSDKITEHNRQWVISFARKYFKSQSFFQATDKNAKRRGWLLKRRHRSLGDFDFTFDLSGFVPREHPVSQRGYFDEDYFRILCRSRFTLCPAGDAPWSMRFYEAILSKSIPIVEKKEHIGRNSLEYAIGYKYYLADDEDLLFRSDWVEENFSAFVEHQTVKGGRRSNGVNAKHGV